jgi:hypothetical protein
MKRVTTVTLIWLGCWILAFLLMAVHFAYYYPAKPVDGGTVYYHLAVLFGAPAVLGTPVVGILWVVRFFAWALHRGDAPSATAVAPGEGTVPASSRAVGAPRYLVPVEKK